MANNLATALLYKISTAMDEQPWDEMKARSMIISGLYRETGFDRYADRILECSRHLKFGLGYFDPATLSIALKLLYADFCRVRHCAMCQWRRSVRWQARAFQMLPRALENYSKHRWLMLTLTVKNCAIEDLRATIAAMNDGFKKWAKRKGWPAIGWIKALEVTRSKVDESAHPHFHALLLVPPTYYVDSSLYRSQVQWTSGWQSVMNLDYKPIVNVKSVRNVETSIPELLKYTTKSDDLIIDAQWLLDLTIQMDGLRAIAPGGVLRDALREIGEEPHDLIGRNPDGSPMTGVCQNLNWCQGEYRSSYEAGGQPVDIGELPKFLLP